MSNSFPSPEPGRFTNLASLGLRVFPVKSHGKEPACRWAEFRDREPTTAELAVWDTTDFNVGVVTGKPSNICVFDIDSAEAQALVDALDLPLTPTVKTGKGQHLLFRMPAGGIRNSVRVAGQKLDIRGDGGYVVGPGSIHETGARYEWLVTPDDVDFAEFPTALVDLLDQQRPARSASAQDHDGDLSLSVPEEPGVERFVALTFEEACCELRDAEEGTRNDKLFKVAARVARHIAAAEVDWEPFASGFRHVATEIGLDPTELDGTLASAWRAGSAEPTPWVGVVRDFIFLSNPERFYHVPSGKILRAYGFNGQYGRLFWGKEQFSKFLQDFGYVRIAYDIEYQPLEPAGFFERKGVRYWNTYRPTDITPVEGDPSPFAEFVEYLVPDATERAHLLKVIAYTVRNPGRKVRHAVLLRSAVQGVGKSMLAEIWGRLHGSENVRKTTSAEMSGAYQGWIKQCTLIICEELNIGQGKAAYNSLKDLITSDTARVNEKYIPEKDWDIFATFLFLTNLEVPLLIEEQDRRIFYIDSPAAKRDKGYYTSFVAWWRQNLGVIRWYVDQIDLSQFDPHAPPPMTAAKRILIEDSRTNLAKDLAFQIAERNGPFDKDVITLRDLRFQLDLDGRHSERALGKALGELGAIKLGQHWVGNGRQSLWAIRNVELWSDWSAAERVAEYQRNRGLLADFDFDWLRIGSMDRMPADRALFDGEGRLIVSEGDLARILGMEVDRLPA